MYVILKAIQSAFSSSMYLLLVPDSVCRIKHRVEGDGMELARDSCLQWRETPGLPSHGGEGGAREWLLHCPWVLAS